MSGEFDRFVEEASRFPEALPIGQPALDALLPHGVARSLVTEVSGRPGTGRSTILLQLAATALENPQVEVIFVDFKKDIYWTRLKAAILHQPWGCLADLDNDVAPRVHFHRFTDVSPFVEFLEKLLPSTIFGIRRLHPSRIIVFLVDNLSLPFKWLVEVNQGDMLASIKRIGSQIRLLTAECHLYTLVCNAMVRKLDIDRTTGRLVKEFFVPSLGRTWLSYIDTRVVLQRPADDSAVHGTLAYCWCGVAHQRDPRSSGITFTTFAGGLK